MIRTVGDDASLLDSDALPLSFQQAWCEAAASADTPRYLPSSDSAAVLIGSCVLVGRNDLDRPVDEVIAEKSAALVATTRDMARDDPNFALRVLDALDGLRAVTPADPPPANRNVGIRYRAQWCENRPLWLMVIGVLRTDEEGYFASAYGVEDSDIEAARERGEYASLMLGVRTRIREDLTVRRVLFRLTSPYSHVNILPFKEAS